MTLINIHYSQNNANIYEQRNIDKKWEDITFKDVQDTIPKGGTLKGYALAPEEYRNGK